MGYGKYTRAMRRAKRMSKSEQDANLGCGVVIIVFCVIAYNVGFDAVYFFMDHWFFSLVIAFIAAGIIAAIAEAQRKGSGGGKTSNRNSRHIPNDVKISVSARDGGCCAKCGSTHNLEFDHIYPHSKGGGNTKDNIQLLCRKCNQKKGNKIQ